MATRDWAFFVAAALSACGVGTVEGGFPDVGSPGDAASASLADARADAGDGADASRPSGEDASSVPGPDTGPLPGPDAAGPAPDTEAPVVSIRSPDGDGAFATASTSIDFSGTASDGVGVERVELRVDSGGWQPCSGTTAWSKAGVALSPGGHQVDVRALDAAGNAGMASIAVTVGSQPPGDVPSDLSGITWLHANVSGWSKTANLASVKISGGQICLDYDKATVWPGLDHVGAFVNANPWIFVWENGRWYGATWEWMRHGQTCKNVSSVKGDHIKKAPLDDFEPISGIRYGFMVSGLARDSVRNVTERTQVVMFQWP